VSRYLLVELHSDLEHLPDEPRQTTRSAVFRGIAHMPGVKCVADLELIDRQSLDQWLLPEQYAEQLRLFTQPKRARKAQA